MKGKAKDICPKCKNCKGITRESNGVHDWLTEVECEDPYDGMIKILDADSDICCSMFEQKPACETCARFDGVYCHGQNGTITISYKAYFHEDCKCPLYEEKKETHETKTAHEIELEATVTALLSEVDNLKKRAADGDYYKEISELLKEKLKKANELADSWKRDYERIRDQFIYPIYNILYPDKVDLDINVTDLINNIKNLKVCSEENGQTYKELQEWREKCKEKDRKIIELEARVKFWSNCATGNADKFTKFKRDRDKWRSLYNSLSETCADYDRRCKEECEKKYRDEISKLQNIVTEKEVEIKDLKRGIMTLTYDRETINNIRNKNIKLNQTISDQEITIKALLITIKEMCKED